MRAALRNILLKARAQPTAPAGGGGGGGSTAPLFLGAGSNDRGNATASNTHPTFVTSIDAPVGSVIEVAVYTAHNDGITGFSDGVNTYTAFGAVSSVNFLQAVQMFRSGILTGLLPSGTAMGPTLTDNGNSVSVYGAAIVFPGVTGLDPEAKSVAFDLTGTANASISIPANTTFPQYAGVYFWGTSQMGLHFQMDAAYTDIFLDQGLDANFGTGDFGLRGFVKKLTSAGGPYTAANNFAFGTGPLWASGQATVSVSS